jgi:hypothetical protein
MSSSQPIPLIYSGQAGSYFGTEYERLPADVHPSIYEVGQKLSDRGLNYLGKLTCSQFSHIEVYAYATPDEPIAVSVIGGELGLQGIDCVCKFADESFLTTTTVRVTHNAYEEQKLFRVSLPDSSIEEVLIQHLAYIEDFEKCYGQVQAIFPNLVAIAKMVDEYTIRQQSNQGHGFLELANGFTIAIPNCR